MRRVLVDHARRRSASRRGGGAAQRSLDEPGSLEQACRRPTAPDRARARERDLSSALAALRGVDPESARIVELRFFHGLTVPETAAATGLSARTVDRRWRVARAWLYRELGRTGSEGPSARPGRRPRSRRPGRVGAHAIE
jgi:RNA polymerase sigma factor (TIGR02999 family)